MRMMDVKEERGGIDCKFVKKGKWMCEYFAWKLKEGRFDNDRSILIICIYHLKPRPEDIVLAYWVILELPNQFKSITYSKLQIHLCIYIYMFLH